MKKTVYVYGSCGPLDSIKILRRGVQTFCPPGEPIGTFFFVSPRLFLSLFDPSHNSPAIVQLWLILGIIEAYVSLRRAISINEICSPASPNCVFCVLHRAQPYPYNITAAGAVDRELYIYIYIHRAPHMGIGVRGPIINK